MIIRYDHHRTRTEPTLVSDCTFVSNVTPVEGSSKPLPNVQKHAIRTLLDSRAMNIRYLQYAETGNTSRSNLERLTPVAIACGEDMEK